MANSGLIILVVFCFCLIVGGGITAGLYYGNVTCPKFGAKCSPAPSPGPSPGPSRAPGPSVSWQTTTQTTDESDQTKLLPGGQAVMTVDQCKTLCLATPNCTHFVRNGGGVCKIYSGAENVTGFGASTSYCRSQCQAAATTPSSGGSCSPNYYLDGSTCKQCLHGGTTSSSTATSCTCTNGTTTKDCSVTSCPSDQLLKGALHYPDGRIDYKDAYCLSSTSCGAGKYMDILDDTCKDCLPSTYSAGGAFNCTPCPNGQMTSAYGSTSSSACYTPQSCPTGFTYNPSDQKCHNATTGETGDPLNGRFCGDYNIYPYEQGCAPGSSCVYMMCLTNGTNPNG